MPETSTPQSTPRPVSSTIRDENGGDVMFGTTAMNSQMNAEDQKENMTYKQRPSLRVCLGYHRVASSTFSQVQRLEVLGQGVCSFGASRGLSPWPQMATFPVWPSCPSYSCVLVFLWGHQSLELGLHVNDFTFIPVTSLKAPVSKQNRTLRYLVIRLT